MEKKGESLFIRIIELITNLSLVMMFIFVMAGVISRYVLSRPFIWTDELSRYLMIYMVFLGGTVSFKAHKHPSLTFLVDKLSPRYRVIWDLIIDLILLMGFILLIAGGWRMVINKPVGRTPALKVKYSYVYLAIPLGTLTMFIEVLCEAIEKIKQLTIGKFSTNITK